MVRGLWNEDKDCYEIHGDRFTIILKKERLYSIDKQTPLHSSGGLVGGNGSRGSSRGSTMGGMTAQGKDGNANMDKLIDDATKRGVKILRQGLAVDGVLMHLTVFELLDELMSSNQSGNGQLALTNNKRESNSRISSHKKNNQLQATQENLDEDASLESKSLDGNVGFESVHSQSQTDGSDSYADDSIVRPKAIKYKGNGELKTEEELQQEQEELQDEEGEDEPIPPTLRIVGYNPKTGHKSLVVIPPQAVLEVLVNNPSDMSTEEILTKRKRHFLARHLTSKVNIAQTSNYHVYIYTLILNI